MDQNQGLATHLLQIDRAVGLVGCYQYQAIAQVGPGEAQLLAPLPAGRQGGQQVGFTTAHLLDHLFDRAAVDHLEVQAGAKGDLGQDIGADPAKAPLGIPVADRQKLIIDEHPHAPITLQPALLGSAQLQALTDGNADTTDIPAAQDSFALMLGYRLQCHIDQR
ncbi:hypothetical protein D9M71_89470 [compost metagenome]